MFIILLISNIAETLKHQSLSLFPVNYLNEDNFNKRPFSLNTGVFIWDRAFIKFFNIIREVMGVS